MSLNVAQMVVTVGANTAMAEQGIMGLARMLGSGGILSLGAIGAGLAVAGIGAAAIHMAGDFQTALTQIVTGAGESQQNLGLISSGVLQLARDTGTSTKQLTDGLYMIESGGYHGAAALAILKAAAEGAKVGASDLGVTADATDTILKNYPDVVNGASGAVNTLIATVAHGKTHMEDLATALSAVLPTAAAAGVGLNDVMAAMAAQTAAGVPAADAATHLRQMLIALEAPSTAAKKALASVGLTTDQVAAEMHQSLPGALQMIQQHVEQFYKVGSPGYMAAMKDISGGLRQMQGMLILTSQTGMKNFSADVGIIAGQVQQGGDAITGWTLVQGTFNQSMSKLGEIFQTVMITLGTQLLPVATQLANMLATSLTPTLEHIGPVAAQLGAYLASNLAPTLQHIGDVAAFIQQNWIPLLPVFGAVGGVIASVLVPALIASAVAAWAALVPVLIAAAPFIAVGAAIGLVALGIVELVQHWTQVKAFFANIIATVESGVQTVLGWFSWLYNHNTYIKAMVDGITLEITGMKAFVMAAWQDLVQGIDLQAKMIYEVVSGPFAQLVSLAEGWGGNLLKMFVKGITAQVSFLKNIVGDVAHAIAGPLGFHSPAKEGPGADADTWAPNLMRMYAQGITSGTGAVARAALGAAQTLSSALGGGPLLGGAQAAPLSSLSGNAPLASLSMNAGGMGGSGYGSSSQQPIYINQTITLDGQVLTRSVVRYLPGVIRTATGKRDF